MSRCIEATRYNGPHPPLQVDPQERWSRRGVSQSTCIRSHNLKLSSKTTSKKALLDRNPHNLVWSGPVSSGEVKNIRLWAQITHQSWEMQSIIGANCYCWLFESTQAEYLSFWTAISSNIQGNLLTSAFAWVTTPSSGNLMNFNWLKDLKKIWLPSSLKLAISFDFDWK